MKNTHFLTEYLWLTELSSAFNTNYKLFQIKLDQSEFGSLAMPNNSTHSSIVNRSGLQEADAHLAVIIIKKKPFHMKDCAFLLCGNLQGTGRARLIQSLSSARFCFELSGNSN